MSAASPAPAQWWRDKEINHHFLPINDVESWKVFKTAGGDYALTLHNDDVGFGGEVEYFDSLRQAKRAAERKTTGGVA